MYSEYMCMYMYMYMYIIVSRLPHPSGEDSLAFKIRDVTVWGWDYYTAMGTTCDTIRWRVLPCTCLILNIPYTCTCYDMGMDVRVRARAHARMCVCVHVRVYIVY